MIGGSRLGLLLLGVCLAQPVSAQINPFRGARGTPLTTEDLAALGEASDHLLGRPNLVPGETEPWVNPKTGVKGIVTSAAQVQHKGMACRQLIFDIVMPGPGPGADRRIDSTWCKTASGWKML